MRLRPDLSYQYYPSEDALLLALYFKNPPGRLLRRQWSYPCKVFPDYKLWRRFVKGEGMRMTEAMMDIDRGKVGVLRVNSKYCFPCDNSIIRIDKNLVGSRRIGTSLVVKDNLLFGLRERHEVFKGKQTLDEDELANRDAVAAGDRRCDMWMEFENGLKMLVEMVDKASPHMEEIPLHEPLPVELLTQIEQKQDDSELEDIPDKLPQPVENPQPGKPGALNKNESQLSEKGGKDP